MQRLTNATSGGANVQLSSNVTWSYPFATPPGTAFLRQQYAACLPSNITISSACCARANGTFISGVDSSTVRQLTVAEVTAILNAKYPGRNNSNPGIGGAPTTNTTYRVANYTTTTNPVGSNGDFNYCALRYTPLTSTPLPANSTGYQSGPTLGNYPQSVLDWTACFFSYVSAADFNASRAAYVCVTDDVYEGGVIPGYSFYSTARSGAPATFQAQGKLVIMAVMASGALYVLGLGL